jgi:FtsZ-binding cell division protein ZapB
MSDYGDIKVDIVAEQATANQIIQVISNIDSEKTKLDESRSQAIAELNAHQGVLRFLLGKIPEDERQVFIEELNSSNASESPESPAPVEESLQDDS